MERLHMFGPEGTDHSQGDAAGQEMYRQARELAITDELRDKYGVKNKENWFNSSTVEFENLVLLYNLSPKMRDTIIAERNADDRTTNLKKAA